MPILIVAKHFTFTNLRDYHLDFYRCFSGVPVMGYIRHNYYVYQAWVFNLFLGEIILKLWPLIQVRLVLVWRVVVHVR